MQYCKKQDGIHCQGPTPPHRNKNLEEGRRREEEEEKEKKEKKSVGRPMLPKGAWVKIQKISIIHPSPIFMKGIKQRTILWTKHQRDCESLYKTTWTTQTAAPPSAACTRQETSDHQCIQFQHQASPRHLFTLRRRCSPHHRGLIRLRISDRKFVNHTTEMIL